MNEYENMSMIDPLMLYWPGAETKSTFSKPCPESISLILSWEMSCPADSLKNEELMSEEAGICSLRASGYVTMKSLCELSLFEMSLPMAEVLWTPTVDL